MVEQQNPWGSMDYSQTGTWESGNPKYKQDINLSNEGQQLLDYYQKTQLGLGDLQSGATKRVSDALGQPFDQSSVQQTADKAYGAYTARLDPYWEAQTNQYENKLRNQGLVPGGEGYNEAMRVFNASKNDAYQQANLGAIQTMPQTYQLATAQRQQPLTELSSLMTGAAPTVPQFGQTPGQQAVPGANYLGAAQQQGMYNQGLYNADVGSQNSFTSGLMSAGTMAAMYF